MSGSNRYSSQASLSCPLPTPKGEVVVLGHGSGGRLTAELVNRVFLPAFSNPLLNRLNDSAELKVGASRIVFTTDSFVVNPLRYPGGDIGSLAVNGTVNDLAVAGGQPIGLSAAFILEEGFRIAELETIAHSITPERCCADYSGLRNAQPSEAGARRNVHSVLLWFQQRAPAPHIFVQVALEHP